MMEQTDIARLASMANGLRPDWPNASIYTFIARNLSTRAYRDVAVALAWVAADQNTDTPARILEPGPWWRAATVENPGGNIAPKLDETCPVHPAYRASNCGGCRADELAGDDRPTPPEQRRPDRAANIAGLRAALAGATAGVCPHGVDPAACAEHDPRRRKAAPAEAEAAS
ncbi:MAG: hypothetical protein ACR2JO_07985 [Mycobacteriales bacterium]